MKFMLLSSIAVSWGIFSPRKSLGSFHPGTIRNIFNLSWKTHRYLIETVSKSTHPKVLIFSRSWSPCYLAALIKDDRRTLTGRTISSIASDCDVVRSSLTPMKTKDMKYKTAPLEEQWRLPILRELLEIRSGQSELLGTDNDELKLMINHIFSS